jgi:tetratricopeptide (TPR) repeat protein
LMSLTLLAGLIVTIAPVTIRNWVVAHDFVLISTNGGVNLYIGNNPQTSLVTPRIPDIEQLAGRSRWSLFAYPEIVRGVESITQRTMKHSEVSRYFAGRALEFMRDNPVRALGYAARRALLLWGPREVSNNKVLHFEWKNSAILRWLPGFPLALSGFLMGLVAYWLERNAARRRQPPPEPDAAPRVEMAVLILLFVVVYSASFVPFLAAGRFRAPLIPFLLIFGAYALVWLARRVAARKLGRAAAWAVAWLALYGLANIPLVHYEPDLGRWHLDRATAYAFGGKPDEAIGEYRSAIEANPEFPRTYAELGSLLVRKGEFDEAIANYRKAIELDPSFAQLRRTLAELLLYLDRVEEAVAEYRAALELSPDNAQAWYSLGRALQRSGADDEALEAYRRAVEVDPGFAEARVNMGILLQAKGRVQEAEQAFRRAIESNPNLFEAHYNLASALASQGRIDEALRSLSTALHIRPGHEAARQAWKALKEQQQSRPPPGSAPATDRPTTPTP